MKTPKLLIFDVNETLLDMAPLKLSINNILNHFMAFDSWFALLLQYAWVETLTGNYRPFGELASATLNMTAKKLDHEITQSQINDLLSEIKTLPPHEDVIMGLIKLREEGIQLVALTNGTANAAKAQLEYSKLGEFMESIFSVEEVGYYKPHPAPYQYVLKEMNLTPQAAMMVACHPWDLLGAKRVGLQTCFVQRPGIPAYPLAEQIDCVVRGMAELSSHFKR